MHTTPSIEGFPSHSSVGIPKVGNVGMIVKFVPRSHGRVRTCSKNPEQFFCVVCFHRHQVGRYLTTNCGEYRYPCLVWRIGQCNLYRLHRK